MNTINNKVSKLRRISKLQKEELKLLLKFRFVKVDQISKHKNKNKRVLRDSLNNLLDKGYIKRRFNSSYRLAGKSAEYYLTTKGLRYLNEQLGISEELYVSYARNYRVSDKLVAKSLLIYDIYISIFLLYGSRLYLATKAEISDPEDFPKPLPDLYLFSEDVENKEYFLDIFTDNLFFYIKKRIDQYIKHYESDDWPKNTYPVCILVVPDKRLLKKAEEYINSKLDDHFLDETDIKFEAVTIKDIESIKL